MASASIRKHQPDLEAFYVSHADTMLSQYENINRLLGQTSYHQHPGEFCESLLRDFLRRSLPSCYSVDKGFVFGRTQNAGKDRHGPEIDILIHNIHEYAPLFRVDNTFVIVQAEAVKAMIDVKKTLTSSTSTKAIRNIVAAKQHIYDVLWRDNPPFLPGWDTPESLPPTVFTGVIGFADNREYATPYYSDLLSKIASEYEPANKPHVLPTNVAVLPTFIGCVSSYCLLQNGLGGYKQQEYRALDKDATKLSLMYLLWKLYQVLNRGSSDGPPFPNPKSVNTLGDFEIVTPQSAAYFNRPSPDLPKKPSPPDEPVHSSPSPKAAEKRPRRRRA